MGDQSNQYWDYYYSQYGQSVTASDPAQQYGQQYDAETLKAWEEYWKNNPEAAEAYHAKANGDQSAQNGKVMTGASENGKADNEKSSDKSTAAAPAAEAGARKREDGASTTGTTSAGYSGYIPAEYYQYFGGGFEEPSAVGRSMHVPFRPSPKVTLVAHTIVNPFSKSNASESGIQNDLSGASSDNTTALKRLLENEEIVVPEAKVSATEIEIVVVNNVVKELVLEVIREEKLRVEGKSTSNGASNAAEEDNRTIEGGRSPALATASMGATSNGLTKRFDVQLKATGVSSVFTQNQEAQNNPTSHRTTVAHSALNKGTTQASILLATLQSQTAEEREEWARGPKYGGGRPYRGRYFRRGGRYGRRYSREDEDRREHDRGRNDSRTDYRNGHDRDAEFSTVRHREENGSGSETEDADVRRHKKRSTKQRHRKRSGEDTEDERRSVKLASSSKKDKYSRRDDSERRSRSKHDRKSSSRKKTSQKRRSPSTSSDSGSSRSRSSSISSQSDSDVSRRLSNSSSSRSSSVDRRKRSPDLKRLGRDEHNLHKSERDGRRSTKDSGSDKRAKRGLSRPPSDTEDAPSRSQDQVRRTPSSSTRSRPTSVEDQSRETDKREDERLFKRNEVGEGKSTDSVYHKEGNASDGESDEVKNGLTAKEDCAQVELQLVRSHGDEDSATDSDYRRHRRKDGKSRRERGEKKRKGREDSGSENDHGSKKKRTRKASGDQEGSKGERTAVEHVLEHHINMLSEDEKKCREKERERRRRSRRDSDAEGDREKKRKSSSLKKRERSGERHKSSRKHR
ncbi:hypothetical protein BJ742DRAFT_835472 [Cladochytrium replicatum]|nr:hypothetical protein BJ742DRAFT_835472 [Cladochytrium replicatum]